MPGRRRNHWKQRLACGAWLILAGGAGPGGLAVSGSAWPAAVAAKVRPPALPKDVLAVPIVRQETNYSCGAAAIAASLRYFHVWSGTEAQLYQPLGTTPADGTLPEKMAAVARSFGLSATVEQPMTVAALRGAWRAGKLVILELQAWPSPGAPVVPWSSRWDDGHFAVLIALDDTYAYFMDPSIGDAYTYLALDELVPRWHDINEVRKDPKPQRDYQLGVVIGKPAPPDLAPVAPSSLPRLLRRME